MQIHCITGMQCCDYVLAIQAQCSNAVTQTETIIHQSSKVIELVVAETTTIDTERFGPRTFFSCSD